MSKKTNKNFWNKFYKKKKAISEPSNFALFIYKFLKNKKSQIVDVGCGNGRDLIFFKKKKINFFGIDLSKNATLLTQKKLRSKIYKNRIFNDDFVNFDYKKKIRSNFSIYSRFTWHTITKKNEIIFLKKISKLKNLQYLFIETRSDKDELCGVGKKISKNEYITDHYRRFINKDKLLKMLKKNFRIIYSKEAKGFSKFKKEDPCLIRVIAVKKLIKI